MPAHDHPRYASEYTSEQLDRSRRTLLQVAVALGDFLDDVVLVGGLVPILLIDQAEAAARDEAHIGSVDVDLGLRLAVVSEERYDSLAERLRATGFTPDTNAKGNPTSQRWIYRESEASVVIDFLIDETETDRAEWGRVMHLTDELAALRALGLSLAFQDAVWRSLEGPTLDGAHASRRLRVCGPAAFIVLKSLAFRNRGKDKDAYDLGYVLRHSEGGPVGVATRWHPLPAATAPPVYARPDCRAPARSCRNAASA